MTTKLVVTWVAVLILGSGAWVAFTGRSPIEFVSMMAGAFCVFFILDCVETATGRKLNIYRFGLVVFAVIVIGGLFHVSDIASTPIALILAWKFENFLLRYQAAKAIRELKEKSGVEGLIKK